MFKISTMVPCTGPPIGVGSALDDFQYVAGCVNDAGDRLRLMLAEEDAFVPGDYIANVQTYGMDKRWRETIAERFFHLTGFYYIYHFSRETALLALSLLDRYLSTASVTGDECHLAALSCLNIAIKYCEYEQPRMCYFLSLANGQFEAKHMQMMEQRVLRSLGLRINQPTPSSFARAMLTYLNVTEDKMEEILESVQYLIELAACDYDISATQKPSSIALGSIVSVINRVGTVDPEERATFLYKLKMRFNLCESNQDVVTVQGRLNSIFYRVQQRNAPAGNTNGRDTPVSNEKDAVSQDNGNPSPTSVDDVAVSLPSRKLFLMRSRLSSRSAGEDAEDAELNDRPLKRARA
mmetsp:Transcript_27958/g.62230  ORF Transcript_27958/g.62230 Transcript_27958/m.62230 type:complete len:351 (+) Transcript_27958:273-1325(+)